MASGPHGLLTQPPFLHTSPDSCAISYCLKLKAHIARGVHEGWLRPQVHIASVYLSTTLEMRASFVRYGMETHLEVLRLA